MSDAPETIWALYTPEVGFIVASDEPIDVAVQYTRADHSQALIAAAYEAAGEHLNWQWYPDEVAGAVRDGAKAILQLTPADAQAALDKLIADAERRGMERAAQIVEPNNPRNDWTEYARIGAVKARLIRAEMEPKT
jgi:hypothetical protein